MLCVYANLVRAPRLQDKPTKGEFATETNHHFVIGYGNFAFSVPKHRHF
jgi:hypothetical protein